jgi:hypothetical protein
VKDSLGDPVWPCGWLPRTGNMKRRGGGFWLGLTDAKAVGCRSVSGRALNGAIPRVDHASPDGCWWPPRLGIGKGRAAEGLLCATSALGEKGTKVESENSYFSNK